MFGRTRSVKGRFPPGAANRAREKDGEKKQRGPQRDRHREERERERKSKAARDIDGERLRVHLLDYS